MRRPLPPCSGRPVYACGELPPAPAVTTVPTAGCPTAATDGANAAGVDDVEAPGADEVEAVNFMTGVIVTPATFPVMAAFSFLLVVPRAARVAFAFAEAATRASVDRG